MIKLAIIGTGGMANRHAEEFNRLGGVQITACCDIDLKKAKPFAKKHNIPKIYSNYNDLFASEPLDAVTIVTNDSAHAPISIAALKKNLHILCEKPLATSYADAQKMVRLAKQKKRVNMVNFSYQTSSAIQKARQLVQSGELGHIVHVEASYLQSWMAGKYWGDWRKGDMWLWRMASKSGSTGVLGGVGCHILDLTTYVVGDIRQMYCQLLNTDKGYKNNTFRGFKLDANESAVMNVTFENDAVGTIHTSRWACGHKNDITLRVFGTQGGLEIILLLEHPWNQLKISKGSDLDRPRWKTLRCGRCVTLYERFIKSIKTGINDSPDFAQAARIQLYIEKAFESNKINKPVSI